MDVMEPKLVWVEGRRYRFYESDAWGAKDVAETPYVEDSSEQELFTDADTCPAEMDIISISGGRYKHSFYVPKMLFKFLIGPSGSTKKKLERDTKTTIMIPRMGTDGDIVITSSSRTAIISARHRINLIVESSRKKIAPTHFISIPMRDETIASNFEKFKETVANETAKNCRGVQEGLFQKPEKMHLTLGMLVLVDDDEVIAATEALRECYELIIKPIAQKHNPIKIKAQGLEYFQDDPTEVNVLYGKVSSEKNVLEQLSEKVVEYFVQKGLMRKEHDKLRLHLTLMNASFIADRERSCTKFDATNIINVHKDYFFGETVLKTIHLCRRGATANDGYYTITSQVDLID